MTKLQDGKPTTATRWTTIDGMVWTMGREQYKGRISLREPEGDYLTQVMAMNEEGEFQDVVSHRVHPTRIEAEIDVLNIISSLLVLATEKLPKVVKRKPTTKSYNRTKRTWVR